jgi:peptidyl-tRNA hydrolase, PTH1 family
MDSKKILIVGLGNPGNTYKFTRHNIGFRIIEELALKNQAAFDGDKKCSTSKYHCDDSVIYLLKPLEFMNLSGACVQKITSKFKISTDDLLVIHDEIDFPFGKIKLKFSGGHAGHNGLRSIIDNLGTNAFHRLRYGIGRPIHPNITVSDYVLSSFSKEEEIEISNLMNLCLQSIQNWIYERTKG